jgi:RNA polymerase sigma-70 factor (ECF subfamily)
MEQEQFIREVAPLRGVVVAYAKRMQSRGDEAEDVAQEVLLKLWDMRRELFRYRSVRALAIQMTKYVCINRLKVRERYEDEPTEGIAAGETASPHRQLEQRDQVAHLTRIIDRLPALQQAVLRMKHIDGLEVEEIARITGCSPEAIRANLSRGRKKVKELFFRLDI